MIRTIPTERILLALILAAGAGLRLWLLLGPYREIDADEAVVGLMAMQMPGEVPAFYWEQHYLGTIEPLIAALVFSATGPSAWALKLVPAAFSMMFVALVYLTARPVFGAGPALVSALYLAVPPSFLAAWSVKARGGYPEALALGQLCLLAARTLADDPPGVRLSVLGWALLLGLSAGLALWTHPLAVVMVGAGGTYLLFAVRPWDAGRRADLPLALGGGVAALGLAIGLLPAIWHNAANGFPSLRFATEGGTEPRAALLNLWGLVRYGLPVLVGLAQGTPSRDLLLLDWPTRPGSSWLVTAGLIAIGPWIVWWHRRSLWSLFSGRGDPGDRGPALFLMLLLLIPPFVAVSRFANLWAEPRYALPIYAATPLIAGIVWAARARSRPLFAALLVGLMGVNLFSLATGDYRLSLPTSAGESTTANRAELIEALQERGIDRIYTDYWLAYSIAFESCEAIVPDVWSSGFSRRASYSHMVFVDPNPAFVFARDTPGDAAFRARLAELGGSAAEQQIGIYRIYTDVTPLDRMRRPLPPG